MNAADVTAEMLALAAAATDCTDPAARSAMRERAWSLHQLALLDLVREVESAVLSADRAALDSWTAAGLLQPGEADRAQVDDDALDSLAHELFRNTPAGLAFLRVTARR
ncbi:hypothetical protein AB0K51_26165 [Kitasatospora sp. NPDC049285]|uniref:hypothetical protein n=1 Tax=Kitasatospora sp. NPDC049285 TaxID=3157096 RepID=UPI003448597E